MISVEHLKVEFGVKPLFSDVGFVINDRDRIALVGKNGAGKSTMLKILCGMQKPTEGTVSVPADTTRTTSRSTSPRPASLGSESCSQMATFSPIPTSFAIYTSAA